MMPEVVIIDWVDAFAETEDFSRKKGEKTEGIRRTTVGFFVAETDDGVVLATDYFHKDKDSFYGRMMVPWGCIERYDRFYEVTK